MPLPRHIVGAAVQVEKEQADTARLERLDDGEAVGGGTEHAVELGGNQRVTGAKAGPELRPFRPLMERDCAGDAGFDMDGVKTDAALQRPAFELAPLNVEALAVLGLAVGRDAAVSERARLCGRGRLERVFWAFLGVQAGVMAGGSLTGRGALVTLFQRHNIDRPEGIETWQV